MNLKDLLLRGIYAYGFEKPSKIQQRGIMPILAGHGLSVGSQCHCLWSFVSSLVHSIFMGRYASPSTV